MSQIYCGTFRDRDTFYLKENQIIKLNILWVSYYEKYETVSSFNGFISYFWQC
ncbi:hypothetical protein XBKB1_4190010 [Xenorhabdus bovienii str. kraussei Becker Underwood]|uniref:Uncharacterized protein n=1 Tax=Xenorhabdus bovienii str. kraussei Becker Underwood TaxID=1398204 RepID=A0A077PN05_XENBV|nr:hypothetical protein XBKB1_4190010 [Xenorhabdus bovienii str. kraussei Becker Underwood]